MSNLEIQGGLQRGGDISAVSWKRNRNWSSRKRRQKAEPKRWMEVGKEQAFSRSDDTLKETGTVMLTEESGGCEAGEVSGGQVVKGHRCHTKEFKLYPVGKGEER